MGIQHTGNTCKSSGNGKCQQLVLGDIDADGLRCNAVVPDSHDGTACAGVHQIHDNEQGDKHQDNTYGKGGCLGRSRNALGALYQDFPALSQL